MEKLCERYEALIRQEFPEKLKDIKGDDWFKVLTDFAVKHNLFIFTDEPCDIRNIEFSEEAYKRGWVTIINDGKVLGFRKEKPFDAANTKG